MKASLYCMNNNLELTIELSNSFCLEFVIWLNIDWLLLNLYQKAEVKLDEEGKEIDEPLPAIGNMPDLVKESKIWESAGVSFGEYELMLLIKSIKSLAAKSQAT